MTFSDKVYLGLCIQDKRLNWQPPILKFDTTKIIDWLMIASGPTSSISANGSQSIYIWECHCHRKGMNIWVGTTNLIFCSDYNAPTLFQNLQKMSLTCRERCTLQTCYQLWYTIRVSVLQPNNPPSRRMSYPPSEDILSSNVGLRLGNLHQYPYI